MEQRLGPQMRLTGGVAHERHQRSTRAPRRGSNLRASHDTLGTRGVAFGGPRAHELRERAAERGERVEEPRRSRRGDGADRTPLAVGDGGCVAARVQPRLRARVPRGEPYQGGCRVGRVDGRLVRGGELLQRQRRHPADVPGSVQPRDGTLLVAPGPRIRGGGPRHAERRIHQPGAAARLQRPQRLGERDVRVRMLRGWIDQRPGRRALFP